MAITIFPTQADVGPVAGDGRQFTEESATEWLEHLVPDGVVFSGMDPTNGGGLQVDFSAGSAFVEGYLVRFDAVESITVPDSTVRGIFLVLSRDGSGRVDGASLIDYAQTTPGITDSILLAVADTAGGLIVRLHDERPGGTGSLVGEYAGDGTGARVISLPRTPSLVMVFGTGSGTRICAVSGMRPPGTRSFDSVSDPALPGFQVRDGSTIGTGYSFDSPEYFQASATWDIPSTPPGSSNSTTITVTGARIGDLVSVRHSSIPAHGTPTLHYETLSARVVRDDVVEVTYSVDASSTTINPASGTVDVLVLNGEIVSNTFPAPDIVYSESAGGTLVPYILEKGFRVGGSANGELNRSANTYHWMAWL